MSNAQDMQGGQGSAARAVLKIGRSCLLKAEGRHFMVKLINVTDGTVEVSFQGRETSLAGAPVRLEFQDDAGTYFYETTVKEGPTRRGGWLLLNRPADLQCSVKRASQRVDTNLSVRVRDQIRMRRYEGAVKNISLGGALIQTAAPFEFNSTIEVSFDLPDAEGLRIEGQIVHVTQAPQGAAAGHMLFGVRFSNADADAQRALGRFVWQLVQEQEFGPRRNRR